VVVGLEEKVKEEAGLVVVCSAAMTREVGLSAKKEVG